MVQGIIQNQLEETVFGPRRPSTIYCKKYKKAYSYNTGTPNPIC